MTNQEVLIQEVQDEISAEMPERLRVIETAQEKDKEIQSRMDRGEIGTVSYTHLTLPTKA